MSIERKTTSRNLSIHPRGNGGEKSNTCKPRRKPVLTDAHRRHLEQHPTDGMSAARMSKILAAG